MCSSAELSAFVSGARCLGAGTAGTAGTAGSSFAAVASVSGGKTGSVTWDSTGAAVSGGFLTGVESDSSNSPTGPTMCSLCSSWSSSSLCSSFLDSRPESGPAPAWAESASICGSVWTSPVSSFSFKCFLRFFLCTGTMGTSGRDVCSTCPDLVESGRVSLTR